MIILRKCMTARLSTRPSRFLAADWRHLAILNYEIDPAILERYRPAGTELDTWDGKHLVSIVGLMFYKTRVFGVPFPLHTDFPEVNLRFYVRHEADGETRRGVTFIKELVPRPAVTFVARNLYNENYYTLPMRYSMEYAPAGSSEMHRVSYQWRHRGYWNSLSVQASGEPELLRDGTEEEFIAEHYWGYATQRNGLTLEYEVEHPRWRVWPVLQAELVCDVEGIYGSHFAETLSQQPISAFLAEGSEVLVRRGIIIAR